MRLLLLILFFCVYILSHSFQIDAAAACCDHHNEEDTVRVPFSQLKNDWFHRVHNEGEGNRRDYQRSSSSSWGQRSTQTRSMSSQSNSFQDHRPITYQSASLMSCAECPYGHVRSHVSGGRSNLQCGGCVPIIDITTTLPPATPPPRPSRCDPGYTMGPNGCEWIRPVTTVSKCDPGYELVLGRCQLIYGWHTPVRKYCPGCYCHGYRCPCDQCNRQTLYSGHKYSQSSTYGATPPLTKTGLSLKSGTGGSCVDIENGVRFERLYC